MNIRVIHVVQDVSSAIMVDFASEYGCGRASWRGEPPVAGSSYEVEVDLPVTLAWGRDILKAKRNRFSLQMDNSLYHLTGICESVSDDGCAFLRLGDTVIVIDTVGEPYHIGEFIDVVSPILMLYDVRM